MLPGLCGRDPAHLGAKGIARAVVESVAENTSDAAVAPLVWGAVAGLPGLAAYRAVNTLDAMVGYRSPRYERFGWAAARLDDVANWAPARLTAVLAAACAPIVGGSPREALRAARRDGGHHPSPNAGRPEAAFAGALGLRLGGASSYGGVPEYRPELGDGRPPEPRDVRRATRLSRAVTIAATALAALAALALNRGNGPVKGALLVAGTSSDAGKSVITAGLCRWLARQGLGWPRSRRRTCRSTPSSPPAARRSAGPRSCRPPRPGSSRPRT